MAFCGFPAEAITFFEGLEADNSKTYWTAQKDVYERAVKEPMETLCAELDDDGFGPMRMFRPYRDVRFSKDKSPYKTATAAAGETEDGSVYYVHLSAEGLFVGSGYYHMANDQLERFRAAVDADSTGREIARITAALEKARYDLAAHESLKTAPRGYAKDHPRIDLLRRKGLVAGKQWPISKWLHTAEAKKRIEGAWRDFLPLNAWLAAHVGPSELPPDERDVR
ncbi:MAG TPA: DUF2461 domain-containing protein [Acidimicrobiales bacterium]|nr:DUF2461 domain-containing protein [Acidimicrobiales bacterium]